MRPTSILRFRLILTLRSCFKFANESALNINFSAFIMINGIEKVNLLIDGTCNCPCEENKHISFEKFSDKCNKLGDMVCGKCQCNLSDCKGYHKPSGDICQYSNLFCPHTSNGICFFSFLIYSGNGKGTCNKNACICTSPFTGINCSEVDCSDSNTEKMCSNSENITSCSGMGKCKCGACICDETSDGLYCENFKIFVFNTLYPTKYCVDFENCAKQHYLSEITEEICAKIKTEIVKILMHENGIKYFLVKGPYHP
ncbi:LOW QUALITY PROTEIN: hypothetical protein MXB_1701, partial [Myxobolus squamalis]